ncbi:MAG: serine hydrolase domain-containing protein [Pseudomonadota bacterium]
MLKLLVAVFTILTPSLAHSDDVASIKYLAVNGHTQIQATGGATASTPFAIASVGKTITSVALLRLADQGQIDLDAPARRYLPIGMTNALGGLDGVTVRHLLTMTSGLPDYLYDDYIDAALADPDTFQDAHVAVSFAYGDDTLFQPGTNFDYSNTNFVLAGIAAETATGRSYASVVTREVLQPAGMSDAFVFGSVPLPPDFPSGHEGDDHYRDYYQNTGFGDGGVIASAQDLANFYRALFVDRSLLSPAMMDALLRDPIGQGYGMGLEIDDMTIGHSGGDLGFSSDVRFDTKTGMIAIILAAQSDVDTDWASEMVNGQ